MVPSLEYIQEKFQEYNRQIFGNKLPAIPIELSRARTYLGLCRYKKRQLPNGKLEFYDFTFKFSTRLDLPEEEIENTIIHEMIHYYIGYNQIKDTSAHGKVFRKMMDYINHTYGRNLTISYKRKNDEGIALRWRVVAVIYLKDSSMGVNVLPKTCNSIIAYYNGAKSCNTVTNVRLFFSQDFYFGKYPSSAALKYYQFSEELMDEHLDGAEEFFCDGKQIIRTKKK